MEIKDQIEEDSEIMDNLKAKINSEGDFDNQDQESPGIDSESDLDVQDEEDSRTTAKLRAIWKLLDSTKGGLTACVEQVISHQVQSSNLIALGLATVRLNTVAIARGNP